MKMNEALDVWRRKDGAGNILEHVILMGSTSLNCMDGDEKCFFVDENLRHV